MNYKFNLNLTAFNKFIFSKNKFKFHLSTKTIP